MTDLFRFIALRPPQTPPSTAGVPIAPSPRLQEQLGKLLEPGIAASVVTIGARQALLSRRGLLLSASQLKRNGQYASFINALDATTPQNAPTISINKLIKEIFGKEPQALITDKGFIDDKAAAGDVLILAKLASDGTQVDVEGMNRALRAIAIVESAAAGSTDPITHPVFVLRGLPLTRETPMVSASAPVVTLTLPPGVGNPGSLPPPPVAPGEDPGTGPLPPLPTGPGSVVTPVGIGDLLVVKQRLKRYERGDVAHVENILRSESFKRDTRRLDRTQTTVTTESDVTTEEERDTQSTDRFSLQRESSNTIKEDSSLKAGLAVSASYGPMVSIKATVDASLSTSKEDSAKQSTSYSKDVTTRAASKISQTTKQVQTMLTSSEYEEDLHHGFDNTTGTNISGVYQWVDKVYEAQVYNYGKRLMFDVMVPEPAAFLISQLRKQTKGPAIPPRPSAFTTSPADISNDASTPTYYQTLAKQYNTAGIDPMPDFQVTVSLPMDASALSNRKGGDDSTGTSSKSAQMQVPAGYGAANLVIEISGVFTHPNDFVGVTVGETQIDFKSGSPREFNGLMQGQTGIIPVAVEAFNISAYTVTITIFCELTLRSIAVWQEKTHATIMQDYQRLEDAYQKAVGDAAAGVTIEGHDPLLNRDLMQTELKKTCITLVTGQQFEAFGAVALSIPGLYPEVSLANAEIQGDYVRFLEEAFEWEQMMYFFYPYYWGRKGRWPLHVLATDPDPQFSTFLNAGFARVVFPVRPGFEEGVLHLLETGQTWSGGEPPNIGGDPYVSIITELQEQQRAPGNETPQGPAWEVTLPTTLVQLRNDDKLPSWGWDKSTLPQWVELV
jgi:hypothetical protein